MVGGLGCLPREAYAGVYRSFRTTAEMPACLLLAYVGTYLTQGKFPPATSSLYVRRACAGDKAEREVWGEEEEEDKLSRSEWRRGRRGGERYGWQPMSGSRGRREGGIHSAGEMPTDYADWGEETGGGRVNLAELRLLFDSGGGRRR